QAARTAGICFRAVVADCFYGDNEGFTEALGRAGEAFVLAVRPRKGVWAPAEEAHTPQEAARQLAWTSPEEPGDWTKVTRRLRDWVEQGYKQVKHELGWADFQVRSDRAIQRHWQLVCCAFSFCWRAWFAEHPAQPAPTEPQPAAPTGAVRGETTGNQRQQVRGRGVLAGDTAPGPRLADPVGRAGTLVAGVG